MNQTAQQQNNCETCQSCQASCSSELEQAHQSTSYAGVTRQSVDNSLRELRNDAGRSIHPTGSARDIRQDAVTAMYVDLNKKQQRSRNIVISGLSATSDDTLRVTELLKTEYEWDVNDWPGVNVARCHRVGKPQINKPQPLIVTLSSSEQAAYYVKNAKFLRGSSDKSVKESVFINADLTPSESKAAYELRLQRRQRQSRQQARSDQSQQQSGRVFYRSSNATMQTSTGDRPSDQITNIAPTTAKPAAASAIPTHILGHNVSAPPFESTAASAGGVSATVTAMDQAGSP